MKTHATGLPGVFVLEPRVHADSRGWFFESFREDVARECGAAKSFVQDNHSCSVPGTIRGLHYQFRRPQMKLVRVTRGRILDVAVDIRRGSPTFGQWVAEELSAANRRQLLIPEGFAHGFAVTDGETEVQYKCTDYYFPDDQHGIRWDDPTLAIDWGIENPIVSASDRAYQFLGATGRTDLPEYLPA